MAIRYTPGELMQRLRARRDGGNALFMAGCGTGLSAQSAEQAGADIIAVYSTAILRMRGLPSLIFTLPYYDANAITVEAARAINPLVAHTPVIIGLGAHDPSVDTGPLLDFALESGCTGIMNEPFASIYGPAYAKRLEDSGLGFSREVGLIKQAKAQGLAALAWAADAREARVMAQAGADIIGAMVLTDGPAFEGKEGAAWFDAAIDALDAITGAAKAERGDIVVLSHGNPFHDVETAAASVRRTRADGYAAGSSGERAPAQQAVTDIMEQYCAIKFDR